MEGGRKGEREEGRVGAKGRKERVEEDGEGRG